LLVDLVMLINKGIGLKYLFVIIYILIFVGCSSKNVQTEGKVALQVEAEKNIEIEEETEEEIEEETEEIIESADINDLKNIPQDTSFYTKNIDLKGGGEYLREKYEKHYFRVWNIDTPPDKLKNIQWPFKSYTVKNSYGENLQPLKQSFFDAMYENSNFNAYATLNQRAISLGHLNIRSFPTILPLLKNPFRAGEGFPFDYLQNSTVSANEPLFVSHYSKDKEWVYIFSNFASGWVKSNDIVFLEKTYTDVWQQAKQVFITKEDIPIMSTQGDFLFKSRVGMMFALIDENESDYKVLAVSAYKKTKPMYLQATLSKKIASKEILTFKKENIDNIISELAKSNYGWGGIYDQRDCSSTLRDYFSVFGIWLPRNSLQQSKIGKVINLKNLTNKEKVNIIKKEGIPFKTLLYKKGHVMLYVGTYKDEIIIFHNMWGVKTKKDGAEGRIVVGKSVFSTLKIGKNHKNYDKNSELLRNLKSMNTVIAKN